MEQNFRQLGVGNYTIYDSNGAYICTLDKMKSDCIMNSHTGKYLTLNHAVIDEKMLDYFINNDCYGVFQIKGEYEYLATNQTRNKIIMLCDAELLSFSACGETGEFAKYKFMFAIDGKINWEVL